MAVPVASRSKGILAREKYIAMPPAPKTTLVNGTSAASSAARVAGVVLVRQRPGSAQGVTFVTLEDETGYVNLIVWRDVAERQRQALVGSRLLGVAGELQLEGEVMHVIARRLVELYRGLGAA